jgi:hypothetical protein
MNSINNANPQINVAPPPPSSENPAEKKAPAALNNGYIYDLKHAISNKAANLVNRLVTRQVEKRMLRCLPPEVKEDVQTNIEGTIQNMVQDITSKSFDTGLNIIKASPGVGNVVSALSAADNMLAGIKNTKQRVTNITDQINKVQDQYNKINDVAAQIGGNGKIVSNNLQTIIDRAHRSISQHRGDVHHLIEHHNRIHKYRNKKNTHKNNSQKGGETILKRAGHSAAQHHVILKRTSKSIRNFHSTTKKLRRK